MKSKPKNLITDEDKEVWLKFISGIKKLDDKKIFIPEIKITKSQTFYMMNYSVSKRLDLHGFTINEAYLELHDFLEISFRLKRKEVHIITGKGKSESSETLNKLVPRWLREKPMNEFVSSFDFTPYNQGDLLVKLKKVR